MFGEIVLTLWSGAGLGWWLIAWRLVRGDQGADAHLRVTASVPARSLSIFKPLPPLAVRGLANFEAGLESFIAQLDDKSELLLGIHEEDRATVAPFLAAMADQYPKTQLRAIFRPEPDAVANPKVATLMALAPHAAGDLWLWSDADVIAPPGFLAAHAPNSRGAVRR